MATNEGSGSYKLNLPIDASDVDDDTAVKAVKVLALDRDGSFETTVVQLNADGQGEASLTFSERPTALRVFIGPKNASDEAIQGMQTLEFNLSSKQLGAGQQLELQPVAINRYYWHWWLRWCREFTIRGVVRCPDGRPVPGAKVCAFDVDAFWWWSSTQHVGCATTDATGSFEIKFNWCCGWWPWWWWLGRVWRVEPKLAEHILPKLQKELKLPRPSPRPRYLRASARCQYRCTHGWERRRRGRHHRVTPPCRSRHVDDAAHRSGNVSGIYAGQRRLRQCL